MASSEGNNTEFQSSEPTLCSNGCGFFGTAATMGLCSKCYRDLRIDEERAASAKAALKKLVKPESNKSGGSASSSACAEAAAVVKAVDQENKEEDAEKKAARKNRCANCNKKVGLLGFECRCGHTFCGVHRYAENHDCTFDFKGKARENIAKANPVIKSNKLDKM